MEYLSQFAKRLFFMSGNTYNIITKVNGKLGIRLQTVDRCVSLEY